MRGVGGLWRSWWCEYVDDDDYDKDDDDDDVADDADADADADDGMYITNAEQICDFFL
jgi:hypothetical protein